MARTVTGDMPFMSDVTETLNALIKALYAIKALINPGTTNPWDHQSMNPGTEAVNIPSLATCRGALDMQYTSMPAAAGPASTCSATASHPGRNTSK